MFYENFDEYNPDTYEILAQVDRPTRGHARFITDMGLPTAGHLFGRSPSTSFDFSSEPIDVTGTPPENEPLLLDPFLEPTEDIFDYSLNMDLQGINNDMDIEDRLDLADSFIENHMGLADDDPEFGSKILNVFKNKTNNHNINIRDRQYGEDQFEPLLSYEDYISGLSWKGYSSQHPLYAKKSEERHRFQTEILDDLKRVAIPEVENSGVAMEALKTIKKFQDAGINPRHAIKRYKLLMDLAKPHTRDLKLPRYEIPENFMRLKKKVNRVGTPQSKRPFLDHYLKRRRK